MGVMTQQQIKNNVYQLVTNCYVETLHQNHMICLMLPILEIFVNSDEEKYFSYG
jgi:hypothetical protein